MKALQIAASGMSAQQMRVDVVSHNLANMSTTGYNARRAEFADLHYQQVAAPGTVTAADGTVLPTGIQMGLGVRPTSVSVILAQGAPMQTSGDLDVMIEGKGYLEVTLPSGGSAYTRDGALKRTGDGLIVTSDGYPVAPGITIPSDARRLTIGANGDVYASFAFTPKPRPPVPPDRARRAWTGWARCGRAIWRKARSTRCAR
jgi:flagellar basal-body rod protein FlgG